MGNGITPVSSTRILRVFTPPVCNRFVTWEAKRPMPNTWRRFEVLLPLQFNDGRDVPPEWLADAVLEIVDYFGLSLSGAASTCVEVGFSTRGSGSETLGSSIFKSRQTAANRWVTSRTTFVA